MNEIWLVRHGETEWSRTGQHTGRTDIPLTAKGQEQARRLEPWLAGQTFEVALSSPLQRAQETYRLAGLRQPVEPCPDLMEWDYGDLEGRKTVDIRKDIPDWSIWTGPVPHGEGLEQVGARARAVLERCGQSRSLLFAHGHILRVLAACWLGLTPQEGRLFVLSTGSLSVLGWEHQTRTLNSWNRQPA